MITALSGLDEALHRWQAALGPDHVLIDPRERSGYQDWLVPVQRDVPAVLRPGNTAEVQQVVRIAADCGVPLYPISTGRNWGYGSAHPVEHHNVIVDLSRMRRIEVHRELAYAVVEPGVTLQMLHDYLRRHALPLCVDPTGAGPQGGIVGNLLERGYGVTPYGDHFAQLCGMDVVLADGQLLRTGLLHYPQARAARVFPRGPGPALDGLFTQSNLGIVTRIGLWLMPTPAHFELCVFRVDHQRRLAPLVEAVRGLLMAGTFRGAVNLMHRNRLLTLATQFQAAGTSGTQPLPEPVARRWAEQCDIGLWSGVAGLYGTHREVVAARRTVQRALRPCTDQIAFYSPRKLAWLERLVGALPRGRRVEGWQQRLRMLRSAIEVFTGTPHAVSLRSAFWRSSTPPPAQLDDLAGQPCGLIWFSPIVPLTAEATAEFRELVEAIFQRHGLECCITFTSVTARAWDCTLPILYNRTDPEETARAMECYDELFARCMDAGFVPYRVGIQSMRQLGEPSDPFWQTCQRLKQALDPHAILAPGRYELR